MRYSGPPQPPTEHCYPFTCSRCGAEHRTMSEALAAHPAGPGPTGKEKQVEQKEQIERGDRFLTAWSPCPSCGDDHDRVDLHPVMEHPEDDPFAWVGVCPTTGAAVPTAVSREDGSRA